MGLEMLAGLSLIMHWTMCVMYYILIRQIHPLIHSEEKLLVIVTFPDLTFLSCNLKLNLKLKDIIFWILGKVENRNNLEYLDGNHYMKAETSTIDQ